MSEANDVLDEQIRTALRARTRSAADPKAALDAVVRRASVRRRHARSAVVIGLIAAVGLSVPMLTTDDRPTVTTGEGDAIDAPPSGPTTVVSRSVAQLGLTLRLNTSTQAPVLDRVRERLDLVTRLGLADPPPECYPDRAFYVEAMINERSVPFRGEASPTGQRPDPFLGTTHPAGSTASPVVFGKLLDRPGAAPIAVMVIRVDDPGATSVRVELATGESSDAPVESGWSILALELSEGTNVGYWQVGEMRVLAEAGREVSQERMPHVGDPGDHC